MPRRCSWSVKKAQSYVDSLLEKSRKTIHLELLDGVSEDMASKIPSVEVDFFDGPVLYAGEWVPMVGMIYLNKEILDASGKEAWKDICAHEVAHVLHDYFFPGSRNFHDSKWKALASWLGARPEAGHNYPYDHVCAKYPDKFFLYADESGKHWAWLTRKQHSIASKSEYEIRSEDGVVHKAIHRPDLAEKIRRLVR